MSAPPSNKCVANECLIACGETWLSIFALSAQEAIISQALCLLNVPPLEFRKIWLFLRVLRSSGLEEVKYLSKLLRAKFPIGTIRSPPPLPSSFIVKFSEI